MNKDKEKVVTIEEDRKTLEYQETMNLDIENFPVQVKQIGDQYMKLLMIHIKKRKIISNRIFRPL